MEHFVAFLQPPKNRDRKEDDRLSRERLEHLQQELAEMREEFAGKKAQWDNHQLHAFILTDHTLMQLFRQMKRLAALALIQLRNRNSCPPGLRDMLDMTREAS